MNRPLTKLCLAMTVLSGAAAQAQPGPLPPLGNPPVPAGNPITEAKRVLGKILFWDEQFSSSGTVSCATCHSPEGGGADARRVRQAGPDAALFSADDIFGSPGVVGSDANNDFAPKAGFAFASQVTGRAAQSIYMAAFAPTNFWDGRAGPSFVDPVSGATILNANAALEDQCVEPPLSSVEMAHDQRSWAQILSTFASAEPLALADTLPADVAAALADNPSYPTLFARAFGTPELTAPRVAMAIATYERTLVPNQTPWDRFNAGDNTALTPQQQQGLQIFTGPGSNCVVCHGGNQFTNHTFRNIGLRPVAEDRGRQNVTNNPADRGRFKTPSLRNVGLKDSFFHNGSATTLTQVVQFYAQAPGAPQRFLDNLDPAVAGINIPPQAVAPLVAFLTDGLTDPRVTAATFPFDKPRLWSLRADLAPVSFGRSVPAPGGASPVLIAGDPALIGAEVRIGVGDVTAGRIVTLRVSTVLPASGPLVGGEDLPDLIAGSNGTATARLYLAPGKYAPNAPLYAQWIVRAVSGGPVLARSDIGQLVPFCPRTGCPSPCPADLGSQGGTPLPDGELDNNDFVAFIDAFFSQGPAADMGSQGGLAGADGFFDNNDLVVFIERFFQGCP